MTGCSRAPRSPPPRGPSPSASTTLRLLRGRARHRALLRRAGRGRVAREPLHRRGRARADRRRLRAARRRADPAARPRSCPTARSSTATSSRLRGAAASSSPSASSSPLVLQPRRVLRRRRRLERGRRAPHGVGELPGAVHPALGGGGRARPAGCELRLITPPTRAGASESRPPSTSYIVLLGLASRHLGVPSAGPKIGSSISRRAAATERITDLEAAFAADGELLALRYGVIEDVGAYVRAPEPATLYRMHGSLSGAYRVRRRRAEPGRPRTAARRASTAASAGHSLLRARADDHDLRPRLGLDPVELRRRIWSPDDFPYRTPSGGLYDSGDYEACLDDALELSLRRAAHRAGRRRDQGRSSGSASLASSSRRSRTWATSRSRRPLGSAPVQLPKSGNAEGATVAYPDRRDHGPDRHDATGSGSPDRRRAGDGRRARVRPEEVEVVTDSTLRRAPGPSPRELLLALLGRWGGRGPPGGSRRSRSS